MMHEGLIFDKIKQKRACAGCARMFSWQNRFARRGQRRKEKYMLMWNQQNPLVDFGKSTRGFWQIHGRICETGN
jgi:hypothetical protein